MSVLVQRLSPNPPPLLFLSLVLIQLNRIKAVLPPRVCKINFADKLPFAQVARLPILFRQMPCVRKRFVDHSVHWDSQHVHLPYAVHGKTTSIPCAEHE